MSVVTYEDRHDYHDGLVMLAFTALIVIVSFVAGLIIGAGFL